MKYLNFSDFQREPDVTDQEIYELIGRAAIVERDIISVTRIVMRGDDKITIHYHKNTEEIYIVLNGAATMVVESEILLLKQGDVVVIYPGEKHAVYLGVGEVLEFLAISHPAFKQEDHYAS